MNSQGKKNKQIKTNSKKSISDIELSGKNSEIQDKKKSISISEKIHQNSIDNIKNVLQLSNDLKNKEDFNKFLKENQIINEIYENEEKMNDTIKGNCTWKLNNDIFEEEAIKILSDFYELTEYNMYPYFDVGYSKTKKSNVIKLIYNQVNLSVVEEKEEKEVKDILSLIFLADRDIYMLKYEDWPLIIQKYRDDFYTLTVLTQDCQNSIDFEFKKGDKISTASFLLAEINPELMEAKNDIKKLKNEKDSLDNKEQKDEYKNKLESYEKILLLTEKKYSKGSIEHELNIKRIDQTILEEKVKLKKINCEEAENSLKELRDKIDEYSKLLKRIIITIEKKDREFDGLFFASKKITLDNTIGDKLEIPEKSPIIVEVKNIIKYNTIIENIRSKKQLMSTLGFNTEKFYFIGILRGIDVNQEKKEKLNKTIFKNLNMKNMIIIYADKLNFLGKSLRGVTTTINAGENLDESSGKNIYEIIIQLKNEIKKDLEGVRNEIKNEISGIKADMNGFKTEIKTEINQIKTEINNIKKDINELKNK